MRELKVPMYMKSLLSTQVPSQEALSVCFTAAHGSWISDLVSMSVTRRPGRQTKCLLLMTLLLKETTLIISLQLCSQQTTSTATLRELDVRFLPCVYQQTFTFNIISEKFQLLGITYILTIYLKISYCVSKCSKFQSY